MDDSKQWNIFAIGLRKRYSASFISMKTRNKVIIGIFIACMAVAVGIWMEVRKAHRMQEALELALEQNRSGIPFTSDTIVLASDTTQRIPLRHVAAYYNAPLRRFLSRHSSFLTLNSSLIKSLYALGCVYRDLHEAPIALLTWEDAIAAADTTSADCDYATLYRVYGQMAEMYMRQRLPEKQLECEKQYTKYALYAGDTLISLHGRLLCNSAYYTLGDTAAIFTNSEAVRQQYLQLGLKQEAAQVYPAPIHVAVDNGQFERARTMMDEYELNSGLFGEDGFIINPTRTQYHSYKGHYYLGIHKIDSAERQFRKLLSDSIHYMDACRGLFKLYQVKHEADSAFKYGQLYENAMSQFVDNLHGDAIIQAQAMYDYQRHEKDAREEHKKNQRITSLLAVLCLLAAISYVYAIKKRRAKAEAMRKLEKAFAQNEKDLEKARTELRYMKSHLQDIEDDSRHIVTDLEERIHRLEDLLKHDAQILGKLDIIEREDRLMNDETVLLFQRICQPHYVEADGSTKKKPVRNATNKEWEALRKMIKREHLSCFIAIESTKGLTPQEKEVAYLSRIGLMAKEMAIVIGCPLQSISNARSNISEKMFNLDDPYKLNKKLKDL